MNIGVKLKILMVITTLDTGGAEKHLHLLSKGLIRKGHTVELVYLKGAGSLAADFEAIGVRVSKAPFESPLMLLFAVLKLAAIIRKGGYDIVHSHLLKADLIASAASLIANPGMLIASKHNDERALLNPVYSMVHGLISRRAKKIIVLSDHVGRFVVKHGKAPAHKIERIYYGLDPNSFKASEESVAKVRDELPIKEGATVITMVARFAPQKDHATLLEAARMLKEEGLDFRILLVGDDPFGQNREKMQNLCHKLGLNDRVIFTGVRKDVPAILECTDIFVMPTNWEGLGLVFLEAMAFQLPVVSTSVSAVPEIVSDSETGYLLPPNDTSALKGALADLILNPDKAESLGKAGRKRLISLFSLDRMIDETEKAYISCKK